MNQKSLLFGLNEAQKTAVLHGSGPLLIVAGAGAGKTKTITHRIAHLIESGVPAQNILAMTFTNKAAGEMRDRVRRLVPSFRGHPMVATFHALCVRVLREFPAKAGVPERFHIWDQDDQIRAMKRVLKEGGLEDENPRSTLAAISRQKGSGVSAIEYGEHASTPRQHTVSRAWIWYEAVLHEASALDFDDLLLKALRLLERAPDVRELLQSRWPYIIIDEYQDTNALQYEIARLLAGEAQNICVVGDLDQCIYTWRQARLENLLSFERAFSGAKVVRLEENFRSSGTILAAANNTIEKNRNRIPKELRPTRGVGEPIYVFESENETEEAWFIATKISELLARGSRPRQIAVLYRNNYQSRALEEAMLEQGIPYRVIGTRFFERKEVKDVLSYVRAALNRQSAQDISRIITIPPRGIGQATLAKALAGKNAELPTAARAKLENFYASLAGMQRALETLPLSEALRFVLEESGLQHMYKNARTAEEEERFENVRELVNLAVRYDGELSPRGAEALLEEAALQSDQDEMRENDDRVSLMTIHASKGLEFETVFLTGLEQGLFPSLHIDETTDPEEERRLMYVALTRAMDRLFLTFARARLRFGSRERAVPSEFLADIDPRLLTWAEPTEVVIE